MVYFSRRNSFYDGEPPMLFMTTNVVILHVHFFESSEDLKKNSVHFQE